MYRIGISLKSILRELFALNPTFGSWKRPFSALQTPFYTPKLAPILMKIEVIVAQGKHFNILEKIRNRNVHF